MKEQDNGLVQIGGLPLTPAATPDLKKDEVGSFGD